jgi:transcriptional regulator with XRE-family HTH domain
MSEFRPAKRRVEASVGESARILRELQELTQGQLADLTGMPQSTISAIENGRVNVGVEQAKVLARVLKCHPAVLVFPGWDVARESAVWPDALEPWLEGAGESATALQE